MSNKKTLILIGAFIAVSIAASLILSGRMPETMATHWDELGQANGYSSKTFGLFFTPAMQLGLAALLFFVPMIDPRRENIRKFRGIYNGFLAIIMGFFTYVHVLSLAWNLGIKVDFMTWMIPAFAVLFFAAGSMISRAEPNFFIGIRTPWTLSDNTVWQKTHAVGGWAFKASAVISLLGMLFPGQTIWFMLVPVMASALGLVVYSYVVYRQLHPNT
jgi:uncharacterized membrane protein